MGTCPHRHIVCTAKFVTTPSMSAVRCYIRCTYIRIAALVSGLKSRYKHIVHVGRGSNYYVVDAFSETFEIYFIRIRTHIYVPCSKSPITTMHYLVAVKHFTVESRLLPDHFTSLHSLATGKK